MSQDDHSPKIVASCDKINSDILLGTMVGQGKRINRLGLFIGVLISHKGTANNLSCYLGRGFVFFFNLGDLDWFCECPHCSH